MDGTNKPAWASVRSVFNMADLSICPLNNSANGFWLRDQTEGEGVAMGKHAPTRRATARIQAKKQKTFTPAKSENEGIQEIPRRTRATAWPHPSLCREVGPAQRAHDER